ncbi:type IV toxin-antitoxin system AbiEi family antitoxin [Sansalvadorimonas verongulae]|uniref:type IV toxin-antitoxin system AbiEi family antitoxin n=1 Tax=Sansalvadorimonas verongulae TaxID=2172824 RepID=UPI0012BD4647|nr:DUF6088 family protein [Sansalvadorimonas verongulae]MTI12952.1 hypothetical protein [Sansalvadorimonas verongulae]
MDQATAIRLLSHFDRMGRCVFTKRDLAKIFNEDKAKALQAGLARLVKNNILQRVLKGIYIYTLSQKRSADLLEQIAATARRWEYNYISLESALSEYGVISQVPVDRLTIMTTGRKGTYRTPLGTLEFTHTKRSVADILDSTLERGRPLLIANKQAAFRDLKRVGRNLHLIDETMLNEDEH